MKDCVITIEGYDILERNRKNYKHVKYSVGCVIYGLIAPMDYEVPKAGTKILLSQLEAHEIELPPRDSTDRNWPYVD